VRVDHPRRGGSVSRSGVGWGGPSRLCRAGGGSASDLPGRRATHGSASRRSCVVENVGLTGVEEGDRVRVPQPRAGRGLEEEAPLEVHGLIAAELRVHHLERERATEGKLPTGVDPTHPSARDEREDATAVVDDATDTTSARRLGCPGLLHGNRVQLRPDPPVPASEGLLRSVEGLPDGGEHPLGVQEHLDIREAGLEDALRADEHAAPTIASRALLRAALGCVRRAWPRRASRPRASRARLGPGCSGPTRRPRG
jgi:hypothetical protein